MSEFFAALGAWDHGIWSFLFYCGQAFYAGMPANPTGALLAVKKIADLVSAGIFILTVWHVGWKKLIVPNFIEMKNGVFTFGDDDRKNAIGFLVATAVLMTPWVGQIFGGVLKYLFAS